MSTLTQVQTRTRRSGHGLLGDKPSQPSQHLSGQSLERHKARVKRELQALGVSRYGLWHPEAWRLPHIILADERIGGVVYGRCELGFAMLIATDRRILFLSVLPMFMTNDEVGYDVVSGVSLGNVGVQSTVTLHTRIRDYSIRTYNRRCADRFIAYIESRCLVRRLEGVS